MDETAGRAPPDEARASKEPETTAATETLLPHTSIWPAAVALSATFVFAGLVTNPAILVVGFLLFVVALYAWIQELRHESE